MYNFSKFLIEEEEPAKQTKLGHLSHNHRLMNIFPKGEDTEEEKSYGGHRGIETSHDFLEKFHDFLRGKKVHNKYTFSEKMEGAPSFLVRRYGGKTSVGYKGAAGNPDKLVSTDEEIEKAYGHAPGLVKKLKEVRDHAGKVLPDSQIIYQGDHMGSSDEITDEGTHWSTQSNTVRTHFDKNETPPTAKLMMALHTMYDRGGAKPIDRKTRESFGSHPDVLNIDPTIHVNSANYTPEEQAAFANHMENARQAYERIQPKDEEFLRRHGDNIEMFINRGIREGIDPTHENFIAHMNERSAKKVAGLKSESGRAKESMRHSDAIKDIVENKRVFEAAIKLSAHHQAAGDVLRKVAAKNSPHVTSIDGEATDPEGVVMSRKNADGTTTMSKITNPEFTRLNLQSMGKIAQAKAAAKKQTNESVDLAGYLIELYAGSSKYKPVHHSFRRSVHIQPRKGSAQIPVRTGVSAARNQHQQYAARTRNKVAVREESEGGDHAVIVGGFSPFTNAHNELVNNAKSGKHSSVNVFTTESSRRPISAGKKVGYIKKAVGDGVNVATTKTPYHALAQLHASGKRGSVTVYGGSDRAAMAKGLEAYNGKKGPHGYYKFDSINFKQFGGERSEGSAGLAGISGSAARKSKSPAELKKFIPKALHPHAEEIFKQINENDVSSVRGLGYVTGDPAAGSDQLAAYFDANAKTNSEVNNTLNNQMKTSQSNLVGFKSYVPGSKITRDKSLIYWDADENGDPLKRTKRK